MLLHRPAGIIPAIDLRPGLRQAGEDAAEQAIQAGTCVADLSAVHLLGLISEDDRLRVRAAMPNLIAARASVGDATLTRDQMRGLAIATYTASLRPDGTGSGNREFDAGSRARRALDLRTEPPMSLIRPIKGNTTDFRCLGCSGCS